jgi:CPA2 family monovalent cation:H+ antiporter-2
MNEVSILHQLILDLLTILTAGFVAGIVCRWLKTPLVVGYLVIGALIGNGVLGLLRTTEEPPQEQKPATVAVEQTGANHGTANHSTTNHNAEHSDTQFSNSQLPPQPLEDPFKKALEAEKEEESEEAERKILEHFAHLGVNLMLFAIGLHFSPSELRKIWRFFLIGGSIQMLGVIIPLTLFVSFIGIDWKVGVVLGSAVSLSSTVLVFKSLEDMRMANSRQGISSIAILLFQDVAIVPLMVLIGLMAALYNGSGGGTAVFNSILTLSGESLLFIAFVFVMRLLLLKFGVPFLAALRSVELMVLFTAVLWIAVSAVALRLGLPGAMGALAAGVILSENRLTNQITAITVSLRETFSAIFFVSLGALFDPSILFSTPVTTLAVLIGCIALKTAAAGAALRVLGIPTVQAFAMGLGLSQLGELSFVLLSQGVSMKMFDYETYQRILFVALTSIILTPFFLNFALKRATPHLEHPEGHEEEGHHGHNEHNTEMFPEDALQKAVVVGLGPIGIQVANYLDTIGFDVFLIDTNPVNLHHFAQLGYHTACGNGTDKNILQQADVKHTTLFVITMPDDAIAAEITKRVKKINDDCIVMSRCRFTANQLKIQNSGADLVTCDETELANAAVRVLRKLLR